MDLTQFNEIQISDREMLDENIFDKEEGGIDEINVPDRLSGNNNCLKVRNTELTKKLEENNIILKSLMKEKEKIIEQKEKVLEENEKSLSKKEEIIKNLQNQVVGMG